MGCPNMSRYQFIIRRLENNPTNAYSAKSHYYQKLRSQWDIFFESLHDNNADFCLEIWRNFVKIPDSEPFAYKQINSLFQKKSNLFII